MREPPTNICPLMCIAGNGGECIQERCAFWSYGGSECSICAIANAIQEAGGA